MATILEMKEKITRFYGRNELYINPVLKFLLAFVTFLMINQNIGFMASISRTPIALLLALVCSIIPINGMIVLASAVIVADMYALSLEVCLVTVMVFAVLYLVYFRFAPKYGYDVVLMPVCFKLHIPYVMPVGEGLLREGYSVFAVACGTILFFFLDGVRQNAAVLSSTAETEEAASKIVVVLNQLMGNKEMYLVLGVMAATTLTVYIIRRLSIENAWGIAIIAGILLESVGLIAGYMLLGISGRTVGVLVGNAAAALIAFLLQFLFFNLDYSRTERLQFEDDEYFYYVKAVPKAVVSGTDKKITRFGGRDDKEERLTKKRFAEECPFFVLCRILKTLTLQISNHSFNDIFFLVNISSRILNFLCKPLLEFFFKFAVICCNLSKYIIKVKLRGFGNQRCYCCT